MAHTPVWRWAGVATPIRARRRAVKHSYSPHLHCRELLGGDHRMLNAISNVTCTGTAFPNREPGRSAIAGRTQSLAGRDREQCPTIGLHECPSTCHRARTTQLRTTMPPAGARAWHRQCTLAVDIAEESAASHRYRLRRTHTPRPGPRARSRARTRRVSITVRTWRKGPRHCGRADAEVAIAC